MRAQGREVGIATGNQPLVRKRRMAEFKQAAFIEEPELEMAALRAACGSAPSSTP